MAIHKGTFWDPKNQHYVGNVNYGTAVPEACVNLATEALVFLAVGLRGFRKHPIAYVLQDKCSAKIQAQLISDCISLLHAEGINVLGVVFDGAFTNQQTATLLGCNLDVGETTAWSYWYSCFTTVHGFLMCQIHSLQAKRGISIPINCCVQCCQGNWISFPQTCCGCRYKCTKWKEHWLEDPKYCLWINGHKGVFHQPCSFLWPQGWSRKRPHIFFAEAGHFKIPAPEADNIQQEDEVIVHVNKSSLRHTLTKTIFKKISKDKGTCMYICT